MFSGFSITPCSFLTCASQSEFSSECFHRSTTKPRCVFQLQLIHPFIHFLHPPVLTWGRRGVEPIPAFTGREAGYTLDRSPVHQRATQRQSIQPSTLTLTPRNNLESPINLTCMFLGGGRKLEYHRKPKHTWGEHTNSTQKGPSRYSGTLLLRGDSASHRTNVQPNFKSSLLHNFILDCCSRECFL